MTARLSFNVLAVLVAGASVTQISGASEAGHVRNRFWVKQDSEVMHVEPAPHGGSGQTTAYRYFDEVKDARVIFRKRALPKGSSIGMHVLDHDEVYYVLEGQAELTVDDSTRSLRPSTAVFMVRGANVGIRQAGDADLVIIVAYPPPQ